MDDWTVEIVAERLAEAAAVIRHLPPVRVPGYFNTRPPMVMEFADRVGQQAEPMRLGPATSSPSRAALGAALIEAGYATPESDGPEQAVAPPPEAATAGPQRRRPR